MLTSPAGLFDWCEMAVRYEAPGKQAFRELLLALAQASDCRSYGTFWGTGTDSRLFAAAGLDVLAAEVTQAKFATMDADASANGYRTFHGRAGKAREHRDIWHADFDGGPSPDNFSEVRRIAGITDRWLAVTLSLDHLRDESMQGEAAAYTIPAWLTGSSGFTLEYLSRYVRNRFGQMMWVAILQRREGKGNWHPVQALQIAYSIGERGYWASRGLYALRLLPHRYSPRNAREKAGDKARYQSHRVQRLADSRARRRADPERQRGYGRRWREANPERMRTARKRWYEAHKADPEYQAKRKSYQCEWYLRNREKQIAAERARREKRRLVMAQPERPSEAA